MTTLATHQSLSLATRDGFGQGMLELGATNPLVYALCADLTTSMRLSEFEKKYPDRFVQLGVAEQNMMGVAAGLALVGKIPFAASFAIFNPGRNWEQLRNSVAYSELNVKVVGGHAGLCTGKDGATHQCLEDIALTRVLPNMTVVVPCDARQAKEATLALANINGPAYLRLSTQLIPNLNHTNKFEIGRAQKLQSGSDITIVTCGDSVHDALTAASSLEKRGFSVEILNLHTLKPIDQTTIIESANHTHRVITVEDHQLAGGLSSAVSEIFIKELNRSLNPSLFFDSVGVQDKFGESGGGEELKAKYKIDASAILKKALSILNRKL